MRRALITGGLLAGLAGVGLLTGCAVSERYYIPTTMADARLLFDSTSGWPRAQDLVYGGGWPIATGRFQGGEDVYFREQLYDVQGLGPRSQDYVIRRFSVIREGTAGQ